MPPTRHFRFSVRSPPAQVLKKSFLRVNRSKRRNFQPAQKCEALSYSIYSNTHLEHVEVASHSDHTGIEGQASVSTLTKVSA